VFVHLVHVVIRADVAAVGIAVDGREEEAALALPVVCCYEAGDDRGAAAGCAATIYQFQILELGIRGRTLANRQTARCRASSSIVCLLGCRPSCL
jgi:hypothetical protein